MAQAYFFFTGLQEKKNTGKRLLFYANSCAINRAQKKVASGIKRFIHTRCGLMVFTWLSLSTQNMQCWRMKTVLIMISLTSLSGWRTMHETKKQACYTMAGTNQKKWPGQISKRVCLRTSGPGLLDGMQWP